MECPHCRHFNPTRADACELCRRPLVEVERERREGAPPTSSVPGGLRRAGQCVQCGGSNPPQAERCRECDAVLPRPRLNIKARPGGNVSVRSRLASCYLICPPLPPLLLQEGSRYVLGRGDSADIMLPGELVSRSHARLTWKEGNWFLDDLGSSNGTFHNGTRLSGTVELDDGDTFTVGGFHMAFQVLKGQMTDGKVSLPEVVHASTVSVKVPTEPGSRVALEGRLDEMSLAEVLQLLMLGARSGVLEIVGSSRGSGRIRFGKGEIVSAETIGENAIKGKEALFDLALARDGEFRFVNRSWSGDDRQIKEPAQVLIAKALRLYQEHHGAGGS